MASLPEEMAKRLNELLELGAAWSRQGDKYWLPDEALGWVTASANLVAIASGSRGTYHEQIKALLLQGKGQPRGVPRGVADAICGLLAAFRIDLERGLVREVEYLVVAEAFDDFLDHADGYHRGGRKVEAAVLVSAVFEDGLRRLSKKAGLDSTKKADVLIDELGKVGTVTPVAAKRLKAAAGLRNKADHADWDAFDLADVGQVVRTTRELIELLDR